MVELILIWDSLKENNPSSVAVSAEEPTASKNLN